MKYTVRLRGGYYHAIVYLDCVNPVLSGLQMISAYWDPVKFITSTPVAKYSEWTVRAYRLRTTSGRNSWLSTKNVLTELFDWADAEDLTFALGFYLRPKRIFVNCNLGATSHRPKGKKQYTEWETGFRQNIEALASKLEMIGNN